MENERTPTTAIQYVHLPHNKQLRAFKNNEKELYGEELHEANDLRSNG